MWTEKVAGGTGTSHLIGARVLRGLFTVADDVIVTSLVVKPPDNISCVVISSYFFLEGILLPAPPDVTLPSLLSLESLLSLRTLAWLLGDGHRHPVLGEDAGDGSLLLLQLVLVSDCRDRRRFNSLSILRERLNLDGLPGTCAASTIRGLDGSRDVSRDLGRGWGRPPGGGVAWNSASKAVSL